MTLGRRVVAALRAAVAGPLVAAAAGCDNGQSTLHPESDASRQIADVWWVFLAGAGVVFAIVLLLLLLAVLRRRSASGGRRSDSRATKLVLVGGLVLPLITLPALFGLSVATLPATNAPPGKKAALTIDVVGHQWFWSVSYRGTRAVTANEIHVPVGETVRVHVSTSDVIHSFWVPELNRKIDTIPGRDNSELLRADRPGAYRGQCAEYCGLQHAHMAFTVYAEPRARFRAWLGNMAKPRRPPAGGGARRGEHVFLSEGCGGCHTIRGTPADGRLGPDLTHLATRSTIAALTLPNSRSDLAAWILDPQHAKPGNKMPGLNVSRRDLQPLVDYLSQLR
jgi:cytochrome c oxidase subunit 2